MCPELAVVFCIQLVLAVSVGRTQTTVDGPETTGTWNRTSSSHTKAPQTAGCGLDHCATCSQTEALCTGCDSGHVLTGNNQCAGCPANCTKCTPQGCLTCQDGLYVSEDGLACQQCRTPNCRHCFRNQTCSDCTDGFYVDRNECKACQEECTICHKEGETLICDACSDGHLLVAQSFCLRACQLNCKSCEVNIISHAITCTKCQPGFYVTEDGSCSDCPKGCLECHVNGSRLECGTCNSGLYVDINYNCSDCDVEAPCTMCTRDPPVCLTCTDSYRLQEDPTQGCQYDPSHDCYSCTSGCPSTVIEDASTVTTRYCRGLTTSASCTASRTDVLAPGKSSWPPWRSYSYGCEREVCGAPPGVQVCRYHAASTTLVCSRCCGTRLCNDEGPPGVSLHSRTELDELVQTLSTNPPRTAGAGGRAATTGAHTLSVTLFYLVHSWYSHV